MYLHFTEAGFLVILPSDNPRQIVDAMLEIGYNEEFCVSLDFSPDFIARLMASGFLVMSAKFADAPDGQYILLPKLHLTRSALFFDNLHIKKSVKRLLTNGARSRPCLYGHERASEEPKGFSPSLDRYELRYDTDFDFIVNRCQEIHGDDWLTGPLVSAIRNIRQNRLHRVYPMSFALYRNDKLVAGEFGVKAGKVYTSYSGYYDESNAGTVQLILATRWLRENGFAFFDLGMPMDYKTDLGAVDISPEDFVALFRAAQR